jgi:membrane-bound serine protease (ClpP class)
LEEAGLLTKRRRIILILVALSLILTYSAALGVAGGEGKTVYVIPLEGPVEKGLASFLARSFREAERADADVVILEINTPGGFVDAAFEISELIREQSFPVYAYVRNQAFSAGAYIALSCDRIYMAPGSVIGAAEPRSFVGGEEITTDEKILSAWTEAMVSVAEKEGRDPEIATAMVRREVSIEGVVKEGELLTLSSARAEELGYNDGTFRRRADLLAALDLNQAKLVETREGAAERLSRIITNPTFATLLLTIAIAALIIEVMTAGFGVAGSISILAFVLFFGGHIFAGLAGYEVVILFIIGLILLLIEAFLPNFGIVGGVGIIAVSAAVVLSAADTGQGLTMFILALIFSGVIIALSFRFLSKRGIFQHIILSYREDRELGYVGPKDYRELVGKKGITVTPLRPAGTAQIEGLRIDVVSEGGFISAHQEVEVTQIEGMRVVVRAITSDTK